MSDDLKDAYAFIYNKPKEVKEDFGIVSIPAAFAATAEVSVVLKGAAKGAGATAAKAGVGQRCKRCK